MEKKFHVWGPLAPKPLVRSCPKSVSQNNIHPSAWLQKFVPIAQYLRWVICWKPHSPQSREEVKQKTNKLDIFTRRNGNFNCNWKTKTEYVIRQTGCTIRFASYEFLYMFHINNSTISDRNRVFQQMTLFWPFKVTKGKTGCTIRFAAYEFLYMFYSNCSAISDRNPVFQQMTLFWPFKVTKGQTGCTIRFASYELLYMFYSNNSAISDRNRVFQQMTLFWPFKVTKGQTGCTIRFASYEFLYMFYCNYSDISHRIPVFSRWPWSDLPRSPKVKLVVPSDSHHMSSYTCFIVTIALSQTETVFFSRWPCSDLSRSPKVKLVAPSDSHHMSSYTCFIPSDSHHMSCYTCFIVTIALSRTENMFFSRWPCSDLSRSPKVKLVAPSDSHHMSSYTCSIVIIAISRTETRFSADDLDLTFQGHQRSNWLQYPIRRIWIPIHVL